MGSCSNSPFVYAGDAIQGVILVWSIELNTSWRVENEFMHPNPYYADVIVNGNF